MIAIETSVIPIVPIPSTFTGNETGAISRSNSEQIAPRTGLAWSNFGSNSVESGSNLGATELLPSCSLIAPKITEQSRSSHLQEEQFGSNSGATRSNSVAEQLSCSTNCSAKLHRNRDLASAILLAASQRRWSTAAAARHHERGGQEYAAQAACVSHV